MITVEDASAKITLKNNTYNNISKYISLMNKITVLVPKPQSSVKNNKKNRKSELKKLSKLDTESQLNSFN